MSSDLGVIEFGFEFLCFLDFSRCFKVVFLDDVLSTNSDSEHAYKQDAKLNEENF